MKEQLVKNFHWVIILYACWGLFTIYEEKESELETSANVIAPMQAKINRQKRNLKKMESFKKNLTKSKERVREVVKQIEKVQRQLPSDVNDTEVQTLIGEIATSLKIRDPQPSPDKETNNGFYFAKEYKFSGFGTFIQFLIFFENLEKAERILNVKSFQLTFDQGKTKGRFPIVNIETVIESFRYNNSYKERSGVEEIENKYGG